jgi:hypothetical protein
MEGKSRSAVVLLIVFMAAVAFFSAKHAVASEEFLGACHSGQISVVMEGSPSIAGQCHGEIMVFSIRNKTSQYLALKIRHGLVLKPHDSSYQGMVMTRDYDLELQANDEAQSRVVVYCIDLEKKAPEAGTLYDPDRMASGPLANVVNVMFKEGYEGMGAQFAIYGATNPNLDEKGILNSDSFGSKARRDPDDFRAYAQQAESILREAGDNRRFHIPNLDYTAASPSGTSWLNDIIGKIGGRIIAIIIVVVALGVLAAIFRAIRRAVRGR